ncbi:MAG TPA: hypothetical protein VE913_09700, partial [Longimicrobium sp.]|nr:hypothetical protein [Longimicrobium sp.]
RFAAADGVVVEHHHALPGLGELGRRSEAARDLRTYLELVPAAPDRLEVERTISRLQGYVVAA